MIRALLVLGLAALLAGAPAHAQAPAPRVALVIGNAAYTSAPGIATAAADATIVAETMRTAGYDVTEVHDLVAADFWKTLRAVLDKVYAAGPEAVAFVYFGGYGAQFDGENYLVPVDARIARYAEVPSQAFRLNDLVRELAELPAAARIIVLDASRDHGFGRDTKEAVPPGLAMMDSPAGMMIAFAAAPGAVSGEIEGPYSLYTGTLVTLMRQPDLEIEQIFKATRLQVNKVATGAQTPWTASTLAVGVKLFDASGDATPAPAAPAPVAAAPPASPAPSAPPPAAAVPPAPAAAEIPPPPAAAIPPVGRTLASRDELRQLPADEAYARVVETDTLRDYQWFVDVYPTYRLTPQVWVIIETRREAILWRRAVNRNTPRGYWNYLKRYPDGPHAEEARVLLSAIAAPPAPPLAYAVEPEPMPPGWWDEAVDLVEVVPQGYDPPPPVFDVLPPVFVVAPPPLFPPPIGFYPPPRYWLVPRPPPLGVVVVAPARLGPVVVIRPPPLVRMPPPLVARPLMLVGGRPPPPPPSLRPLPAFARAPVSGLSLPAPPPGRARVMPITATPGAAATPRPGLGLPPSARPLAPAPGAQPVVSPGTGAIRPKGPEFAKRPPPGAPTGTGTAAPAKGLKAKLPPGTGPGSAGAPPRKEFRKGPPAGAKVTNTGSPSGVGTVRTPPPASAPKPPPQALKTSPPPRPPPAARPPPRPAAAAPKPPPPRRPVCRTVNGKQVCS
ncbi:MAG TPA: caspase family protein [Xanthobacteraceae bacterium]|nr:caspase family protein [Xanthobacteraceae bacterium]